MGRNFINCGKLSAGQIAKICNNAALAIQMFSLVESLNLGKQLGMDLSVLNDIYMVPL
jgi:3-hydroxyisobutyrate dehydrogenase